VAPLISNIIINIRSNSNEISYHVIWTDACLEICLLFTACRNLHMRGCMEGTEWLCPTHKIYGQSVRNQQNPLKILIQLTYNRTGNWRVWWPGPHLYHRNQLCRRRGQSQLIPAQLSYHTSMSRPGHSCVLCLWSTVYRRVISVQVQSRSSLIKLFIGTATLE
jgi:hypothetical protein